MPQTTTSNGCSVAPPGSTTGNDPIREICLSALSGRYCRSVLWDAWIKWVVCRALPRPRLPSNLLHPGAHTKQFKLHLGSTFNLRNVPLHIQLSSLEFWTLHDRVLVALHLFHGGLELGIVVQQTERTLPCGEIPRQVKSLWRLIGGGVWHQLQRRHKRGQHSASSVDWRSIAQSLAGPQANPKKETWAASTLSHW